MAKSSTRHGRKMWVNCVHDPCSKNEQREKERDVDPEQRKPWEGTEEWLVEMVDYQGMKPHSERNRG